MSCAAVALGCRVLPFRDVIVCSSSRVQMSKRRFLDISTLVMCEKGLRREYKIRNYLRKCYARLRTGIHLTQYEVCGNRVACCKLRFLFVGNWLNVKATISFLRKNLRRAVRKVIFWFVSWFVCGFVDWLIGLVGWLVGRSILWIMWSFALSVGSLAG